MEIENDLANLTPSYEKINRVMGLQKITQADIHDFNAAERESLGQITNQALKHLKGEERDDFLNKIESIFTPATNEQIWEYNHLVIGRAIAKLHAHQIRDSAGNRPQPANGCQTPYRL